MESYGELLRAAREEKKFSMEAIEHATAITKNYIESLENERVEDFPGESYFVGFLVNYCEFLGIDKNEILQLYHAKKIQEAPVPVELLKKHHPAFLIPAIIAGSVAVLAFLVTYIYFSVLKIPEKKQIKTKEQVEKEKIHQYQFTGKPETRRLYKGDKILVPAKQGKGNIVLTVGGTLGNFLILTPSGNQIVELSEERELDIDGDGFSDLILYLSDISSDNEANGAEVRILEKAIENSFVELSNDGSGTELSEIPASSSVKNNDNRTVIHEDTRPYPFTINVTFRGSCLFRYKSDRQDYVEGYYKSGELVTVTSNNGTRLWMSNINALKIHVIAGLSSYDLEVGRAGEVQAEDIKWVRDSDGKYRLVVLELD
ncbi:helix-turn-helix domain-containing protein [Treponema sp.]|uniref:helix-turn-helix domain-containing protein n=1 Tax=Treponema sp. TaxID=166 RepID=UPI003EFCD4DA